MTGRQASSQAVLSVVEGRWKGHSSGPGPEDPGPEDPGPGSLRTDLQKRAPAWGHLLRSLPSLDVVLPLVTELNPSKQLDGNSFFFFFKSEKSLQFGPDSQCRERDETFA